MSENFPELICGNCNHSYFLPKEKCSCYCHALIDRMARGSVSEV